MFCTSCGIELRSEDRFCSQCGARTPLAGDPPPNPRVPLALDKRHKKIAGVCAGFARYLDVDVVAVRIVLLILAFSTGVGFIAYLVAWIVMPSDCGQEIKAAGHQIQQVA
jgi:phage shock protein C